VSKKSELSSKFRIFPNKELCDLYRSHITVSVVKYRMRQLIVNEFG